MDLVDIHQHSLLSQVSGLILVNLLEPDGKVIQPFGDEVFMPLLIVPDLQSSASTDDMKKRMVP